MRFAAVPVPKSEPRSPAAEFVRKLMGEKLAAPRDAAPVSDDPPLDLDQRVRLVGEW